MSLQDKKKWDEKYLKKNKLLLPRDGSQNLHNNFDKLSSGYALDLACGNGRNTIFLAENGFTVDAVDIAQIALDSLSTQIKTKQLEDKVNIFCEDLDNFDFKQNKYDLIVMSNFLDRDLIAKTKPSLKDGGVYFVETYMIDEKNEKENSDKKNLLQADELKDIFNDFEILFYDEFDNEKHELYSMKKQVILAKKI